MFEDLRKENLELKQILQASQNLCDATLAKKNDEIKEGIIINKLKLDESETEFTKNIMLKDKEFVKLKHEMYQIENEFIDYKTKIEHDSAQLKKEQAVKDEKIVRLQTTC